MIDFPKVSVVILNWNGARYLREYLPSVVKTDYSNLEIIVADNASADDSLDLLAASFPQVRVIELEKNFGFAGGYNRVLCQIDSDYFVLLNSDVEVTADWIRPVIEQMEADTRTVAAQPKIRSLIQRDSFEYAGAAGGFIDQYGYPFCRGRIFETLEEDNGQYNQAIEIFWATGAALFVKRSAWLEVGGFDEDFFAHMEEIDLCWRLKNKGYRIICVPDSTVYHLGGGTLNVESPHKTYLNFRNNLILIQKNYPAFKAAAVIFCRLWLDLLALLKFLADKKPKNAWAVSRAHQYFFRNLVANGQKARQIDLRYFNSTGMLKGSIVWKYFALRKRTYRELEEAFQRQTVSIETKAR